LAELADINKIDLIEKVCKSTDN